MDFLLPSLGILSLLTFVSILIKDKSELLKYILFGGMVCVIIGYTSYIVWSTISINTASVTKGPVHFHADYQIWNCGKKVNLIDPKGLDSKIGTPLFHEHNDERIHVEGPVLDFKDISLGQFFKVAGGQLSYDSMVVPTNEGQTKMENGEFCNGQKAQLQVFAYTTNDDIYTQQKLVDPMNYVLSKHSQVPPGDCIIIEFDAPKDKTEKICTFYEVAIKKGELIEK